jgi:hypothetical protein
MIRMNRRETAFASIAAVTLVGTLLLLSGVFGKAIAYNPTGAPDYTLQPVVPNGPTDIAQKLIVEIDSPYGSEKITTFDVMQTSNLMQKGGYYTLKLQGFIHADKRTLLNWIAQDIGKLPDGLSIDGTPARAGDRSIMTKPKPNATINVVPVSGTVKLQLLESRADLYADDHEKLRQYEFSGCHVAGYDLFTHNDERRAYLTVGTIHVEQVTFACTGIALAGQTMNSRGITVDTAINNDGREITNEKGELIIDSREYRQPIVMDNVQKEEANSLKQEIVTTIVSDEVYYGLNEAATFIATFTDLQGNAIDPDQIKAYYDGLMIQLDRQDTGVYTYTTPGLTKSHHQIIVSAEKADFATDTTYLSIPIDRIN